MTTTVELRDARDLESWERRDLRSRFLAGVMERGPRVPLRYQPHPDQEGRYAVSVEGVTVGWVCRRDDLPAMDRWHGYVRTPGSVRGTLVATTRQRGEAGEDVALEALR